MHSSVIQGFCIFQVGFYEGSCWSFAVWKAPKLRITLETRTVNGRTMLRAKQSVTCKSVAELLACCFKYSSSLLDCVDFPERSSP